MIDRVRQPLGPGGNKQKKILATVPLDCCDTSIQLIQKHFCGETTYSIHVNFDDRYKSVKSDDDEEKNTSIQVGRWFQAVNMSKIILDRMVEGFNPVHPCDAVIPGEYTENHLPIAGWVFELDDPGKIDPERLKEEFIYLAKEVIKQTEPSFIKVDSRFAADDLIEALKSRELNEQVEYFERRQKENLYDDFFKLFTMARKRKGVDFTIEEKGPYTLTYLPEKDQLEKRGMDFFNFGTSFTNACEAMKLDLGALAERVIKAAKDEGLDWLSPEKQIQLWIEAAICEKRFQDTTKRPKHSPKR